MAEKEHVEPATQARANSIQGQEDRPRNQAAYKTRYDGDTYEAKNKEGI